MSLSFVCVVCVCVFVCLSVCVKVDVIVTLEQATKAQKRRRCIAPLFL